MASELTDLELCLLRHRVLGDVVERLLHEPVHGRLEQRRRPLAVLSGQLEVGRDPDLTHLLMLLCQGVQRRLESDRVE